MKRVDYVPINARPALSLPEGARLAVYCLVAVEEWPLDAPIPRAALTPPAGGPGPVPDVPNWAWHEYGMRVGFWRLKAVLDRHGVRATVALNASVCRSYPPIVEAALAAGWELMGHGLIQKAMSRVEDERATIRETIRLIRDASGKAPRGWVGPGLIETWETADLLAEEGIEYCLDWVLDDQPVELRVRSGRRLVAIPYTLEVNDSPLFMVQHHPPQEFLRRATEQFDTLYAEGRESARVMAMGVHPFLMGVPHRIRYLDQALEHMRRQAGVLFWTGSEILDWYLASSTSRDTP
ncbi:MAG: polysaccharide deacetylase family protein [Candidatus Methylomirabilia bacterium]